MQACACARNKSCLYKEIDDFLFPGRGLEEERIVWNSCMWDISMHEYIDSLEVYSNLRIHPNSFTKSVELMDSLMNSILLN